MWIERITEVFFLGLKSLWRNKLRSFLTMLGIIFGVGSVITMLSVGAGARHEILSRIQELGVRNIIVNAVKPPEESRPQDEEQWVINYGLKFDDAERILETVPTVEGLLRVNKVIQRVWHGSRRVEAAVYGVEPEHLDMFALTVGRGRPFNEIDTRSRAKVCIVRPEFIRELETMKDPLGLWLYIGGYPFRVIGILEDEAFRSHTAKALAVEGRTQEVYVPYATSMSTFGTGTFISRAGSQEMSITELDQIVIKTASTDTVFDTARIVNAILEDAHEKKDYEVVVPLELLQQREETQKTFNFVMILIASISLLVGGIGIANIMLATITERTKEIGIRRALGARRRDILLQFLTETTAIAAVGGILGCAIGIAGIQGIVRWTEWKALIAPHYVLVSLAISCTVGIVFGIFPARRAAQMDPITALRYE